MYQLKLYEQAISIYCLWITTKQSNNQHNDANVAVLYPFMVSTEEADEFLACSYYKNFLT